MALLRHWVRGRLPPRSDDEIRQRVAPLSDESRAARAHFGLGWWLHQAGRQDAAQYQFQIGGELAPDDFMIRRGAMPLRGSDPFGPEFVEMVNDWLALGHSYYLPLPVE